MIDALAAAGIHEHVTIHGLRRTFNNLVRQVASGEVVRAMTGHVTERMTEHYSHVGANEKHDAVRRALGLVARSATESGDASGDRARPHPLEHRSV